MVPICCMQGSLFEQKDTLEMNYKLIPFCVHGDERGKLIALEANQDVPFEIKRVY